MTHTVSPQVRMANDIAMQFQHWTDKDAAATAIANHIKRFWTPRMRADLLERLPADALDKHDRKLLEQLRAGAISPSP
ncbi:formate dehydrogenase subunit delta [Kibdelosporangium lantanae]|uniref:Formate dehydrogenase subunit delta n=1 Tax=Kibdelosporangium lantanae TaxID=1497396 RepID=A0ABW3M3U1_9PSEU